MIELENLEKKFNKVLVLKDISVKFNANELVAIIGPSGSGKTTLLRCMNRLEDPSKGHVIINGVKLTAKNRRKLCQKIGMVFQNFHLFPHMNIKENLIYGPLNVHKANPADAEAKAVTLLTKFGLEQKLYEMPKSLSGGQKQRVAICRALMMDPEYMLFDEPTSALDPESIKDVVNSLQMLKQQMTMIVVTHHVSFAKKIADRVIFMDQGQILADQPRDEFFTKPKSHRAKLFLENTE